MRSDKARAHLWTVLVPVAALGAACSSTPTPSLPAAAPAEAVIACARRAPGTGATRLGDNRQSSAVALADAAGRSIAYIADEDDRAVLTLDVAAGRMLARTPLAGSPAQVLVLDDGRVAVTLRDTNRLQVLEPAARADEALEPLCAVPTPAEPFGIAATPDDETLLVTSAWSHRLSAYDSARLEHRFEVDLPREPRAVLVDDDGRRAFVSHVVGARMSVVDLTTKRPEVRPIDLRAASERGDGELRDGCQGFALAKSGRVDGKSLGVPAGRVFAPMVTVEPGDPQQANSGYGADFAAVPAEAPLVSVVDAAAERTMTRQVLPVARHGGECILPRAAIVNDAAASLLVTCVGSDTVVELDARSVDPARVLRRRWKVASGPVGIALDAAADRAVVWSQFDRTATVLALGAQEADAVEVAAGPGRHALTPELAQGRKLFHKTDDNRLASDGRACASCHPDGREDALTWSTPVGPRQTIMLAGRSRGSAPFSWMGTHEDLATHLRTTFERLGGSGLEAEHSGDMAALVAYLEAMPGPRLAGARVDARHQQLAARGKELFYAEGQGCAGCHVGGTGVDGKVHDVKSGLAHDRGKDFDTPSLRFVAGTAPYFHDGRYATLDALLSGSDGAMGHTWHLPRQDVAALAAFLETL